MMNDQVLEIGSRRELFEDRWLIDVQSGTELRLHQPHPAEVVLRADRPWEDPTVGMGSCVIQEGERYRMYYRGAIHTELKRGMTPYETQGFCIAESSDGVVWHKPNLGAAVVNGSRENNGVADSDGNWINLQPSIDTRPGVPSSRRIIANSPAFKWDGDRETRNLFLHASSDGVRFAKVQEEAICVSHFPNAFDSITSLFWSPVEEQYILYSRYMVNPETGLPDRKGTMRTLACSRSKDLMHFPELTQMTFGDTGVVPPGQLYTNQTEPYYRAPQIYVAFPMRFMEGRRAMRFMEEGQEPSGADANQSGQGRHEHIEFADKNLEHDEHIRRDCTDVMFMSTRAGSSHFDCTFKEGFILPGLDPRNWGTRSSIALRGLIPTGEGELSLYVNRHNGYDSWHIQRYTLRTDGFASLYAPYDGGEMVTKPLTFSGRELEINYRTSAAGFVQIEIQDADGKPISGYNLDDCPEIIGDKIEHIVRWTSGDDIGALAGKPVRLRFTMKDANLYSLRFR